MIGENIKALRKTHDLNLSLGSKDCWHLSK